MLTLLIRAAAIARTAAEELRRSSQYFIGETTESVPISSDAVVARRWRKAVVRWRLLSIRPNALHRRRLGAGCLRSSPFRSSFGSCRENEARRK